MIYRSTTYTSPLGNITLACNGDGLVGLWLDGQKYHGSNLLEAATEKNDMPVLQQAKTWLDDYFFGKRPSPFALPLAPIGGEFRQAIWRILCEIPYGEITTYGSIAKKVAVQLGKKNMSSQAVGGAVGHNPISIIIPCHRVVGANGSLTGYAGGVDAKMKLLALEGVATSSLLIPRKGTAL